MRKAGGWGTDLDKGERDGKTPERGGVADRPNAAKKNKVPLFPRPEILAIFSRVAVHLASVGGVRECRLCLKA